MLSGAAKTSSGFITMKMPHPHEPGQQIILDTQDMRSINIIRKHMGVCPQFDILSPDMTCMEV
jgi:ABC-type multidrug transport system ATPase subunit